MRTIECPLVVSQKVKNVSEAIVPECHRKSVVSSGDRSPTRTGRSCTAVDTTTPRHRTPAATGRKRSDATRGSSEFNNLDNHIIQIDGSVSRQRPPAAGCRRTRRGGTWTELAVHWWSCRDPRGIFIGVHRIVYENEDVCDGRRSRKTCPGSACRAERREGEEKAEERATVAERRRRADTTRILIQRNSAAELMHAWRAHRRAT